MHCWLKCHFGKWSLIYFKERFSENKGKDIYTIFPEAEISKIGFSKFRTAKKFGEI